MQEQGQNKKATVTLLNKQKGGGEDNDGSGGVKKAKCIPMALVSGDASNAAQS